MQAWFEIVVNESTYGIPLEVTNGKHVPYKSNIGDVVFVTTGISKTTTSDTMHTITVTASANAGK